MSAQNAKFFPQFRDDLKITWLSFGQFAPDSPCCKIAKHRHGYPTDPNRVARTSNVADEHFQRRYLERHLPLVNPAVSSFRVCVYTHGGSWIRFVTGQKRNHQLGLWRQMVSGDKFKQLSKVASQCITFSDIIIRFYHFC